MTGPAGPGRARQPARPRSAERADTFNASYSSTPAWDIDRPQPAFLGLVAAGAVEGRVLDVGCGTGEHALMAAEIGLDATGIDAAPAAIEKARSKAQRRELQPRFVVGDALALQDLGEQFDSVLDCGLFHVFDDDERARYVESLAAVVGPGGRYFMLCFSQHQPGDWGPRRVTEDEIRASFARGWRVDSIEASRLVVTFLPEGVSAWLSKVTRTEG